MINKVGSQAVISFDNVSFRYNKKQNWVLKKINFHLPIGRSLTIFGVNGSGKSTLGKLIAGLLLHFEGKIKILNQTLTGNNHKNIICDVGIVFQNPESQFIGEDVENDIAFGLESLNVSFNDMAIKIKNIAHKLEISDILHYEPFNLSGGKKQRVAIASVLVTDPKIVVFDESTSMLDPKNQNEILKIIDQLKDKKMVTVIEITHDIERILHSDLVLILKKGEAIFFGEPQELLSGQNDSLFQSSGLTPPFIYQLTKVLKNKKIIDKIFLDQNELIKNLWKLEQSKLKI